MSRTNDPLRLEYGREVEGLSLVRQSPPAGAVSFSATYIGPAGWGFDPPGESGTAWAVNQLLLSGAGPYDRLALARLLDRAGATLSTDCDPEAAEVSIWGPAADWEKLLALLAEVVTRPRFAPEDVERVRRQLAERQLRELAQPGSRADRELLRAIYPRGHPYRSTGLGDERSVRRIRTDRLLRFHERQYTSGDALLIVTAPARLSRVETVARACFSRFRSERGPSLRFPPVLPGKARTIPLELPGRAQVEIRVGAGAISRSDPRYPAAFLANEVLGGAAQLSRLFRRIREAHGLVYHASSEIEAMRFGGYWTLAAGTAPERREKVVALLARELAQIADHDVSASELQEVRESAIGDIALSLESTARAHELAIEVAYHRLPADHFLQWPALLREVRVKDVRAAAEETMDRRQAVTVLAGPSARAGRGNRASGVS